MFTCLPVDSARITNPDAYNKFIKSAWCGETYDTKHDAIEHKKFFQKTFKIPFYIEKENY